jgi:hypothetical protein
MLQPSDRAFRRRRGRNILEIETNRHQHVARTEAHGKQLVEMGNAGLCLIQAADAGEDLSRFLHGGSVSLSLAAGEYPGSQFVTDYTNIPAAVRERPHQLLAGPSRVSTDLVGRELGRDCRPFQSHQIP